MLSRLFTSPKLQAQLNAQNFEIAQLRTELQNIRAERQNIVSTSLNLRYTIGQRIARDRLRDRREARRAAGRDMIADLRQLERMFPRAYPIWSQLFEHAKVEYEERPNASLSVAGNPGAELFRKYISVELAGHVLDIGCGPLELPYYLVGQSIERLAGIDPLNGTPNRQFEFVQGLAEFLPWMDGEFDSVVIATSLDHVISLDMVFSEIRRVLAPNGIVAIWVGFVKGAKEYDPSAEDVAPIDSYHLFHFDRPWFLDYVNKYFVVTDELAVDGQSHFFSLRRR